MQIRAQVYYAFDPTRWRIRGHLGRAVAHEGRQNNGSNVIRKDWAGVSAADVV